VSCSRVPRRPLLVKPPDQASAEIVIVPLKGILVAGVKALDRGEHAATCDGEPKTELNVQDKAFIAHRATVDGSVYSVN
jgi:hypothetical protein